MSAELGEEGGNQIQDQSPADLCFLERFGGYRRASYCTFRYEVLYVIPNSVTSTVDPILVRIVLPNINLPTMTLRLLLLRVLRDCRACVPICLCYPCLACFP